MNQLLNTDRFYNYFIFLQLLKIIVKEQADLDKAKESVHILQRGEVY